MIIVARVRARIGNSSQDRSAAGQEHGWAAGVWCKGNQKMKMLNLKTLALVGLGVVTLGMTAAAGAQSTRHDRMDGRAAERDIDRLIGERAQARTDHNWGKVRQDNRLMKADWKWVGRDYRRAHTDYWPFRDR